MKALIVLSAVSVALLSGAGYGAVNEPLRYDVTQLPSLGGGSSAGFSINNRGWVAGRSNLAGNRVRHATLWRNGSLTDLGTLGSRSPTASFAGRSRTCAA